jgi:hypothetical protein
MARGPAVPSFVCSLAVVVCSDKPFVSTYGAVALLIDFRLDELCQVSQQLLPTEIASLQRNGIWQTFLHNVSSMPSETFLSVTVT